MPDEQKPEGSEGPLPAKEEAAKPPVKPAAPAAPAAKPVPPKPAAPPPPKPPAVMMATLWDGDLARVLKGRFGGRLKDPSTYLGQNFIVATADMAHTMLFTMGFNAPEDRLLPDDFEWSQTERLHEAYAKMAAALRPWTIDFHVAQNDGTVKGSGSHDKTGHHCQPNDPNGKLDIVRDSGAWL